MATSSLPPLAQATAGAAASAFSNVLVYPLDLVTTRMQTASSTKAARAHYGTLSRALKTIWSHDGAAAFYAGVHSDTLSTMLSSFSYFYFYSLAHKTASNRRLRRRPGTKAPVLSAGEEIALGCLAGIVAKALVSPLSNVTVRQQTGRSQKGKQPAKPREGGDDDDDSDDDAAFATGSILRVAQEIYEEKGWSGFWSGFKSSIVLSINPALTFYLFGAIKRATLPMRYREHPPPLVAFLAGAFASAIASSLTYPLILAKTRLQYRAPSGRRLYSSTYDVLAHALRRRGVAGLYSGLSGQVAKGFLSEGIKMTTKDRVELLIVLLHQRLSRGSIRP